MPVIVVIIIAASAFFGGSAIYKLQQSSTAVAPSPTITIQPTTKSIDAPIPTVVNNYIQPTQPVVQPTSIQYQQAVQPTQPPVQQKAYEPIVYPTYTPYPTFTPWPTSTPYPTATPYVRPTDIPYPTISCKANVNSIYQPRYQGCQIQSDAQSVREACMQLVQSQWQAALAACP